MKYYHKPESLPTLDSLEECDGSGSICAGKCDIPPLKEASIVYTGTRCELQIHTRRLSGAPIYQHHGTPTACSILPTTLAYQLAVHSRPGGKSVTNRFQIRD